MRTSRLIMVDFYPLKSSPCPNSKHFFVGWSLKAQPSRMILCPIITLHRRAEWGRWPHSHLSFCWKTMLLEDLLLLKPLLPALKNTFTEGKKAGKHLLHISFVIESKGTRIIQNLYCQIITIILWAWNLLHRMMKNHSAPESFLSRRAFLKEKRGWIKGQQRKEDESATDNILSINLYRDLEMLPF